MYTLINQYALGMQRLNTFSEYLEHFLKSDRMFEQV